VNKQQRPDSHNQSGNTYIGVDPAMSDVKLDNQSEKEYAFILSYFD